MATEKYIDEQIQILQKQFEEEKKEKQQRKKQVVDEKEKFIDTEIESLQRQFRDEEIEDLLKESFKQTEEYISELSKQIGEKRIVLMYILDELIELREQRKEESVINYLEDKFERLRKERCILEERLFRVKEHIRCLK